MNRLQLCANIINTSYPGSSVLDVGCRRKDLLKALNSLKRYQGIDLEPAENVLAHDVEQPLPFADDEFEVACALDVVEHVEHATELVNELIRVASKAVIISLPNMYYHRYRMRYLMGRELGAKYYFVAGPAKDRHRWLPSYNSGSKFITAIANGRAVRTSPIIVQRRLLKPLEYFEGILARFAPNLFAYGALFVIESSKQSARSEPLLAAAI